MPRASRRLQPLNAHDTAGTAHVPLTSGAGNLSAEDRAEIMGGSELPAPIVEAEIDRLVTEGKPGTSTRGGAGNAPHLEMPPRGTVDEEMIKRIVTIEAEIETLKHAMEMWAKYQRGGPAQAPAGSPPQTVPIRAATPEEERAYSLANSQGGGFDGLQDWRDKGSPGLNVD